MWKPSTCIHTEKVFWWILYNDFYMHSLGFALLWVMKTIRLKFKIKTMEPFSIIRYSCKTSLPGYDLTVNNKNPDPDDCIVVGPLTRTKVSSRHESILILNLIIYFWRPLASEFCVSFQYDESIIKWSVQQIWTFFCILLLFVGEK